jgi:hypothetical protein
MYLFFRPFGTSCGCAEVACADQKAIALKKKRSAE